MGKGYDYFFGDDEEEEQGVKLNREGDDDDAMPDSGLGLPVSMQL